MAAAALSVRGLATALAVLRGALIRTGIGALIVGAGELVYQFTRLVSGAGGFGEAMSLLKDLAVEVWERIRMGAAAAGAAATAMFFDLKADAASGMQSAIESVVGFGNTAARLRYCRWGEGADVTVAEPPADAHRPKTRAVELGERFGRKSGAAVQAVGVGGAGVGGTAEDHPAVYSTRAWQATAGAGATAGLLIVLMMENASPSAVRWDLSTAGGTELEEDGSVLMPEIVGTSPNRRLTAECKGLPCRGLSI